MDKDNYQEKRKHRRIPLAEKDGVYCIVFRPKAVGTSIALSARDFSESGFRIKIPTHLDGEFFEGERLFLKAISGSRNLTFKEPVELRLRWRKQDPRTKELTIGCEIFNITTRARKQFVAFIQAEEKFRGINGRNPAFAFQTKNIAGQGKDAPQKLENRRPLKIVSLFGGARYSDNTGIIVNWVEESLMGLGHQVERVELFAKTIRGCQGCLQCRSNAIEPGCVLKDDAMPVIHKMAACDVVIYASQLYHWGFSAQLKALMERCHCFYRGVCGTPEHSSFVEGQRQALILTTQGPFANNADQVLAFYYKMLFANKAHSAGELFLCNCSPFDALDDEIRRLAVKFADQISLGDKSPYAIMIPGAVNNGGGAI